MFLSRTRNTVGLDIGSHAVKFVALRSTRGDDPYRLDHLGIAELPDETVVDGSVVQPDQVTDVVRELLEQHKVRNKKVATAVSGNAVIVRRITMARMEPEELRESLQWEAEEYIPFDIDEVNLDFSILEDEEDADSSDMDVVLVAAKRDRIDEYVAVVQAAGRQAAVVDVDVFALQNAFELNYPERRNEDVALLNLGASVINLAVLEGGRPAFWRDIAMGVRQYVTSLQREFMLDFYDAEEVLRRIDQEGPASGGYGTDETLAEFAGEEEEGGQLRDPAMDPRAREIIGQTSERIITEVKKTFDFYQTQTMHEHLDTIFLAGGGAQITDLARRLEQRLGWPVERLDPLRRVTVPAKDFDREYIWQMSPQVTVAVGLALREA